MFLPCLILAFIFLALFFFFFPSQWVNDKMFVLFKMFLSSFNCSSIYYRELMGLCWFKMKDFSAKPRNMILYSLHWLFMWDTFWAWQKEMEAGSVIKSEFGWVFLELVPLLWEFITGAVEVRKEKVNQFLKTDIYKRITFQKWIRFCFFIVIEV